MNFKKYPPETSVFNAEYSHDSNVNGFIRLQLYKKGYKDVASLETVVETNKEDSSYIQSELFPHENHSLSESATLCFKQFLQNQFGENTDYDFEASSDGDLAGCLNDLRRTKAKWGDAAFRDAALTILNEDAASENAIEVPAPMDMKVYVPIDVAKHGMPLDEIDLGARQEEKAAHLRYRGIRTTTDLVEAHRDEIPANAPNPVEHALKLFITRFVPLVLVEFSEHHPSDASIHRQLGRLGCTTVWDLTQTTERKLSEHMNLIDIRWVKTTLKEKFSVGLKSPTPEKTPERKPGPGLSGPGGM